jgi:hypothetical protein
MGLDLSMASYNPHYAPDIWHDLPGFGSAVQCIASGDQTFKGIREATPTAITVEMDIGESNLVGDDRGEIIRYNYDGQKQFITRETANCDNPRAASAVFPFLGDDPDLIPPRPRTVRVVNWDPASGIVNGLGQQAIFRYFDARNPATELYPYSNPPGGNVSQIPQIRRIDITLAVDTDEVDPTTKARKRMIYFTSVLVRNHAF